MPQNKVKVNVHNLANTAAECRHVDVIPNCDVTTSLDEKLSPPVNKLASVIQRKKIKLDEDESNREILSTVMKHVGCDGRNEATRPKDVNTNSSANIGGVKDMVEVGRGERNEATRPKDVNTNRSAITGGG